MSVVPAGGFTQQQTGNLPSSVDVLLLTSRLTEVEHYDPGDLTVGVGAGCTISQVSALVGTDGLLLALDPPAPQFSTIGGVLATARHGPLRHGYGGVRDFCLGIRFVTGDARMAKGGGRVVKNVAGYDLMKLLIGSQGTLAVITSASFKLFPAPRQTRTFLAEFTDAAEALAFRNMILRSPLAPLCLEFVSPGAREIMKPGMNSATWVICVRAAGSDRVLARYRSELGSAVTREVEGAGEVELWKSVANFAESVRSIHTRHMLLSFSMTLRDVEPVLANLTAIAESHDFGVALIGRVGIGHLEAALWPIVGRDVSMVNFVNAASALRKSLPRDASMTILHCPPEARHHVTSWGPTPTHFESMRAVKVALDPRDILNQGRFLF
jgi:glycolate oxidase FAD binding subunit